MSTETQSMSEFLAEHESRKQVHNIRLNRGVTVHRGVRFEDHGRFFTNCGSGENSTGSRKRSNYHMTTDPVTCKKCLARIEQNAAISEFLAEIEGN